jgi:hypothetical protein
LAADEVDAAPDADPNKECFDLLIRPVDLDRDDADDEEEKIVDFKPPI